MKIGGLQPVTVLDYPQKVAAIIFTSGCNMRCPFCHNPSLVLPKMIEQSKLMAEEEIFDFLSRRKKYLDGVVITGGEPTIQSDIIEFCKKIKSIGYDIKLDTNGLLPKGLKNLLDQKLIDYVAMDIKAPLDDYQKLTGVNCNTEAIKKSIRLIISSGLPYEFRTTLIKGWHDKDSVIKMAKMISGANKYFLQNFSQPSHGLVDKKFKGDSFTQKEMKDFKISIQKYFKECGFR